ncbi:Protein of uncharacterised function (DUF2817) [Bordetella pertussis]|nr:Protein of uncharacterised function (DUF2817) [Bordetella pertussis]
MRDHLAGARKVALIDWHTGIGGYGEPFFLCFNEEGGPLHELAAREGVVQAVFAVAGREILHGLLGGRHRGAAPVLAQQLRMQDGVIRVGGVRLAVVDEVAVQVDIVLGGAAQVREPPRVDGVHHDDRHVGVQRRRAVAQHPADLRGRAEKTLQPVGAADRQQPARCVGAAKARDIGMQGPAVRPGPAFVQVLRQACAGRGRRGAELVARPVIIERIALVEFHGVFLAPHSGCTVAVVDCSQNTSLRCRNRIRLVPVRPITTRLNRQANIVATSMLTEADWIR